MLESVDEFRSRLTVLVAPVELCRADDVVITLEVVTWEVLYVAPATMSDSCHTIPTSETLTTASWIDVVGRACPPGSIHVQMLPLLKHSARQMS